MHILVVVIISVAVAVAFADVPHATDTVVFAFVPSHLEKVGAYKPQALCEQVHATIRLSSAFVSSSVPIEHMQHAHKIGSSSMYTCAAQRSVHT